MHIEKTNLKKNVHEHVHVICAHLAFVFICEKSWKMVNEKLFKDGQLCIYTLENSHALPCPFAKC